CPVHVISQRVHNKHRAVRTETFIAQFIKCLIIAAFGFINGLVHNMLWDGIRFGTVEYSLQHLIGFRIRFTFTRRHIYFTAELCIDPTLILILLCFLFLDIVPFSTQLFHLLSSKILISYTINHLLFPKRRYSCSIRLIRMIKSMNKLKPITRAFLYLLFFILLKSYMVNPRYNSRPTMVIANASQSSWIKKFNKEENISISNAMNKYFPHDDISFK